MTIAAPLVNNPPMSDDSDQTLEWPDGSIDRIACSATATARVAGRVRSEVARMAGAVREAIDEGSVRAVDADHAAVFLWSAWTG